MALETDKRIELLTENLRPYTIKIFKKLAKVSPENASKLCDFLLAGQAE